MSGLVGATSARLFPPTKKQTDMTSTGTDQERWRRVRDRLQTELGEDVFSSWFGRMELETVTMGVVRLSVPTRFLRNWIQSHYSERVLVKWQEEEPDVTRLELSVRSATIRPPAAKPKMPDAPMPLREIAQRRRQRRRHAFRRTLPDGARSARRLAARSAPDIRDFRCRPFQHARACRGETGRHQPARRAADVQSALHPCRSRPWQNPSAAGDFLGRQRLAATARCSI